jgi:hypothetical protein
MGTICYVFTLDIGHLMANYVVIKLAEGAHIVVHDDGNAAHVIHHDREEIKME